MNSGYYDEIIAEISDLMRKGDYETAEALLRKELSMPYVPSDVEQTLLSMRKDLNYMRSEKRVRKESSLDELLDSLHGTPEMQLAAANALCSRNLREITGELNDWLSHEPFAEAAALIINEIGRQRLEDEFVYNRDGIEYTFWGDSVTPVDESQGYRKACEYLYSWLGMKYPSVYELARKMLVHETYMYLPLNVEEDEAEQLAYEIAVKTADMMGDEELVKELSFMHDTGLLHKEEKECEA